MTGKLYHILWWSTCQVHTSVKIIFIDNVYELKSPKPVKVWSFKKFSSLWTNVQALIIACFIFLYL